MALILSKHAAREMGGRGIALAYIEAVLATPTRTTPDRKDPMLTLSFAPIPAFGNRTLRVVHRPEGADIFVVTAHWDRGARR
jgi:hypothetical protein